MWLPAPWGWIFNLFLTSNDLARLHKTPYSQAQLIIIASEKFTCSLVRSCNSSGKEVRKHEIAERENMIKGEFHNYSGFSKHASGFPGICMNVPHSTPVCLVMLFVIPTVQHLEGNVKKIFGWGHLCHHRKVVNCSKRCKISLFIVLW